MNDLNKEMNYDFDICFITMSELQTDARTLNFIRTIRKFNKRIAVVSIAKSTNVYSIDSDDVQSFTINIPQQLKANQKWRIFNKEIKLIANKLKAKIYWASDFFSLKSARDLSIRNKSKLFYDSREIYSAVGSLNKKPLKQMIQKYLEKKWVKSVDKIIVTGELDADYLKKYFDLDIPFYIVKNFPHYQKAIKSNKLREKFNIPEDSTILLYQGMIMQGRGILPVIKSLLDLNNCYFCLLGKGDFQEIAMNKAGELSVSDRVILAGEVPYEELHNWTCSANIGLALIEPISFSYKLALPNKLFEYAMAQIPSIVSDLPAMRKVVDDYKIGEVISDKIISDDIIAAVNKILKNKNYYIDNCITATNNFIFESQENIIKEIFEIQ